MRTVIGLVLIIGGGYLLYVFFQQNDSADIEMTRCIVGAGSILLALILLAGGRKRKTWNYQPDSYPAKQGSKSISEPAIYPDTFFSNRARSSPVGSGSRSSTERIINDPYTERAVERLRQTAKNYTDWSYAERRQADHVAERFPRATQSSPAAPPTPPPAQSTPPAARPTNAPDLGEYDPDGGLRYGKDAKRG